MPKQIGSIIEATDGADFRPPNLHVDGTGNGDTGGISGPEEVHFDYETIEPRTAPIANPADFTPAPTNDGIRRTRDGRIDRRTRAGRGNAPETSGPQTPRPVKEKRISLEKLLLSLHNIGATLLDVEELALDPEEAKDLSEGIVEVGKHYRMDFDPKKVAIAELLIVAGNIYGTRIMAYRLRRNAEKKNKGPAEEPITVMSADTPVMPAGGKPNGKAKPITERSPSEFWTEPARDD